MINFSFFAFRQVRAGAVAFIARPIHFNTATGRKRAATGEAAAAQAEAARVILMHDCGCGRPARSKWAGSATATARDARVWAVAARRAIVWSRVPAGVAFGSVRLARSNSEHGPPLMDQTVVLCTLAAFLLYYNTLRADFAYDDR